ncbi:hypothetical protein MPSEU_000093300 [Mayamaea pseudoterrestris]|nr:hypothetical protein MPSEU_000093300 [Mayamaea pseudoterrestris]
MLPMSRCLRGSQLTLTARQSILFTMLLSLTTLSPTIHAFNRPVLFQKNVTPLAKKPSRVQRTTLNNANAAAASPSGDHQNGSTKRQRSGMSLAITSVYFTVMAAKCALPATLSLLTDPKTGLVFHNSLLTPQQVFSQILFVSTSAIAVGKLLLGPVIDYFGGIRSLQVSLLALSVLLAIISVSSSVTTFAICWVLVDFIFSSCWAACINAIHQCFPDASDWSMQIGRLAAAARTGNAAAFAMFASLLSYFTLRTRQAWRPIFLVSSVLQLVPVALLTLYGKPFISKEQIVSKRLTQLQSGSERQRSSTTGPIMTLRREAKTVAFWCHLTSRSMLMVFASFLLFVPTLMNQVYGASSSLAARVGSLYAIGCLTSVTIGSGRYAQLSRRQKVFSVVTLMGLATLSSAAQLGHVMGAWSLSISASAMSMFAWGFSFAIPFYIPPSLYALKRGGTESSATIADVFDIGGFALLAAFNGYVAGLHHSSKVAWIPVFQMTTLAAFVSLVTLSIATWKERD